MTLRRVHRIAIAALLLVAALWTVVAVGFAAQAWWRLPELSAWHSIAFEHEFDAARADAPDSFAAYLAQEERLFAELKRRLYEDPLAADVEPYGRYTPGSPAARLALDGGGNRSAVTPRRATRAARCCCCTA
jgi:hypothetical protein